MQPAADRPALDRYGIVLSALCLAHCLALPALIAFLPTVAVVLPHNFWVHLLLFGLAVPISGLALLDGARRHGDRLPLIIGGLGLALIGSALFAATAFQDAALTVSGGLFIVTGHVLNRMRR